MTVKGSQKYNITKEELEKLYLNQCLSSQQISEETGIDARTLRKYLQKYGLSRNQSEALTVCHHGSLKNFLI